MDSHNADCRTGRSPQTSPARAYHLRSRCPARLEGIKWVNKLREAVILILLGLLLPALTSFFYLRYDRIGEIHAQVEGLRNACDSMPSWTESTMISNSRAARMTRGIDVGRKT